VHKTNQIFFFSMSVHGVIFSPTTDRLFNKIFSDIQTAWRWGRRHKPWNVGKI